jgi:hypothetical protein
MKLKNYWLLCSAALLAASAPALAQVRTLKYDAVVIAEAAALKDLGVPDFAAKAGSGRGISIGEVEESVQTVGQKLSISSRLKLGTVASSIWSNLAFSRRTDTVCNAGVPSLIYTSELRGKSDSLITQPDASGKSVTVKQNKVTIFSSPLTKPLVDASALQHCYFKQAVPKAMSVQLATGKSVTQANFSVLSENLSWQGKSVPVIRLYRAKTSQDSGLELWYRAEDGLPLKSRITFAKPAGVSLVATLISDI